jgi:hypothetical protein
MSDIETLLKSIIDLLDVLSYLFISSTSGIFLHLHDEFELAVQEALRPLCGTNKKLPSWVTSELIAYARLYLAIPTILYLSWGYRILPSILVLVVHLADSLKHIVSKYWSDLGRDNHDSAENRNDMSTESFPTFFKNVATDNSDFGKLMVLLPILMLKILVIDNSYELQKLSQQIRQKGCNHYA